MTESSGFTPMSEETPAIKRARQLIADLLVEARITINDARLFEWGISALIEKENAMLAVASDQSVQYTYAEDGTITTTMPPVHADWFAIDHLEGNKRELRDYRRHG